MSEAAAKTEEEVVEVGAGKRRGESGRGRSRDEVESAVGCSAAKDDDAATATARGSSETRRRNERLLFLRRLDTMSAGGSRKINQKVSYDQLLRDEEDAEARAREVAASATTMANAKANAKTAVAEMDATTDEGHASANDNYNYNSRLLREKKSKLERNHMTSSFLAGVGSGILASVACAPLDLIRTRMQVMGELKKRAASASASRMPSLSVYRAIADIIKEDGFRGCFRGLGATLATVPLFWGIYFPLYEELKKDLHGRYDDMSSSNSSRRRRRTTADDGYLAEGDERDGGRKKGGADGPTPCPAIVHMGSAILAGAVADVVCNPMFLVRTRMQTEALHYFELPPSERKPHGLLRTIRTLHAEGGMPVFWRGLTASLMGLAHVAIQFPAYEFLKAEARAVSDTNTETAADLLVASGVAKMSASMVTYPHEVIRSRMMDARGAEAGRNVFQTASRIVQNEGWASLYTGIHVSLLRVVPNCCITFMSYELILRWAKENAAQ